LPPLASARVQIAEYLSTLIDVYTIVIVVYILTQMLFAFGVRMPYSRASDLVLKFLHDVCEPYLRLFRRIIPSFGSIDFSPLAAIIVLEAVNALIVQDIIR
ncbi:MAG: YggT family protein, partial [Solirubrobacteraceae bacterium]